VVVLFYLPTKRFLAL